MAAEVNKGDTGIYEVHKTVFKAKVIRINQDGTLRLKSDCGAFTVDNVRKLDWLRQNKIKTK